MLINSGRIGEPVNICNGEAVMISDILKMLVEISETSAKVVFGKKLFRRQMSHCFWEIIQR